jgi:hypothetical protein
MYMSRAYLFICVSDGRHMPCVRHVTSGPSSCTDEFVVLVDGPLLSAFPYNVHFPRFWIALAIVGAIVFSIVYFPKLRVVRGVARWFARPGQD